MTTFSDLGDTPVETDEFDPMRPLDADPTAAPVDTHLNGDPIEDEAPLALLNPDLSFNLDRGFVDARSAVRVWLDDEGTITKVRVSPSWRDRLAKTGTPDQQASALAAAFQQAFTVSNVSRRDASPAAALFDDVPPGDTPLSWESLDKVSTQLDELNEQIGAIPHDERQGTWQGDRAVGHGAKGKVTLELNHEGGYSTITFDPVWLEESRVGQICDAVPEAAKDARARYVPAEYQPTEFDELQGRARSLRNELTAMLKRGFF